MLRLAVRGTVAGAQAALAPAAARLRSRAPHPGRVASEAQRRMVSTWNPMHRFVRSDEASETKAMMVQVAMVSGGALVVYGVSRAFVSLTSTFLNMNFSTAASIGFVAGFASAGACGALLYSAHNLTSIRPEKVYKLAYKTVLHDTRVEQAIGPVARSGKLRAYKLDGGYFGPKDGTFGWQPPRVQMLFQVQGAHDEGIVTVEAVKRNGNLHLNLLALDCFTKHGRTLAVLQGNEARLHVVGQLRGFLQTERAKYIAQNVDDDVEGDFDEVDEEIYADAGKERAE